MEYRKFAGLGFEVSGLSFGASALGGVFRKVEEGDAIRAVHAALDAGINYIDVAPAYGGTRSETVLGKALRGVPRDRYHISTKVGKTVDPGQYGADVFDYSEHAIVTSLDESRKRIGVDYFDIVHLHDIEYRGRVNVEWALGEGHATLERQKAEGRIGGVSFGIYPMDLWHRIVNERRIDAMLTHNHYCLNDTRLIELLPAVKTKKIALINASPFASGLLGGREPPAWHPIEDSDRDYFRQALRFCESHGVPIAKLALQFSASHPDIHTTLFSSASAESVEQNVRWLEDSYEAELISEVRKILGPVADREWDYDAGVDRLKSG
jgi:L-galactose dehydrogenase